MVAKDLGHREFFNGYRVWFCKMKRVLEIDGGDGCTTMCEILNTTELYT